MIVITGATGNVGRPLVASLQKSGVSVTAVSRHPVSSDGIDAPARAVADLADPQTFRGVLQGAHGLFILVPPALSSGYDPRALVEVAQSSGVTRLVLLSSQAAGTRPKAPAYTWLRVFEAAVQSSGLSWTVLRPSGFATNAYGWIESIRTARAVGAPFADVALPVVDPHDIAEVAATALRDPGHEGRTYVLTGPEPVSPRERVAAISAAIGAPITFLEQSVAEARKDMMRIMPGPVVESTLEVLGDPTSEERRVSPDVERVLGRPATSFSAWAQRNVAVFR